MRADDEALVSRLLEWLEIDSTSGREGAFLEALEGYFGELGYAVERQAVTSGRWNLLATRRANPALLYSTHVDTVPPWLPPRYEDEKVWGRGACDTKGGLLAMCEAAKTLVEDGLEDLGFLLVVGEEVDHVGAKEASALELTPRRIVLCEPTENRVVAAQKGMLKFALQAEGCAGHSAYPDRGISAVHRLLEVLAVMRAEGWPRDALLGPTTLNVGVIEGGVAANVFAPSARAEVIFRAVSSVDALLTRCRDMLVDGVELVDPVYNDPVFFDVPEDVDRCTVPFNTDATYLSELGPVWLVGPGDIRVAHSRDEHISLASLREGIALYERLGRAVLE